MISQKLRHGVQQSWTIFLHFKTVFGEKLKMPARFENEDPGFGWATKKCYDSTQEFAIVLVKNYIWMMRRHCEFNGCF